MEVEHQQHALEESNSLVLINITNRTPN